MVNKKLILTGQLYWYKQETVVFVDDENLVELIAQHFNLESNEKGYYWLTDPQHIARITIEIVDDLDMEHGNEPTQY